MNGWPGSIPPGAAGYKRVPLTLVGYDGAQTDTNQVTYAHATTISADDDDRVSVYCSSHGNTEIDHCDLDYVVMDVIENLDRNGRNNSLAMFKLATGGLALGTSVTARSTGTGTGARYYGYHADINGSEDVRVFDMVSTSTGGVLTVKTVPGCCVLGVEANDGSSGRSMAWTGGSTLTDSQLNGANGNWMAVGQSDIDGYGTISTNSLASDSNAILACFVGR